MQLIDQSHQILHYTSINLIELAGRTCYKSEDKIGCKSPTGQCTQEPPNNCDHCQYHSSASFTKGLIKAKHEAMVEHGSATVRFITDRGVTHELVRHRPASFAQESTRYVNYNKKGMQFIKPVWFGENPEADEVFVRDCENSEEHYNKLLGLGWTPEKARQVLNTSIKTEIVVTANYREWRHIFNLRVVGTTGRPHPQIQALLLSALENLAEVVPNVFDDILVNI